MALSSPTSAITTYTATAGQTYSFRLVVKDNFGGQGSARVHVTTVAASVPVVVSFAANPAAITSGQSSVLSWTVTGADTVNDLRRGNVASTGTASVSPTTTTTYTLTCEERKRDSERECDGNRQHSEHAVALLLCFAVEHHGG